MRIARAELGNFGDTEPVGEDVSEMRIFIGKGYHVYYSIIGTTVVLFLNGGIKSNKKTAASGYRFGKAVATKP
jgi:putative addiction module killer protein